MTKEEFLKAIMELPKVETINPISTMNSINIDDLMSAVDRLNKVPDYNDLLKENKKLQGELKYTIGIVEHNRIIGKKNKEIHQLREQLLVTQTNEETFRLEMEDITKILGLDEDTIFDDVKAYVRSLKDNWNELRKQEINRFNKTQDVQFLDVLQDMQELEQGSDMDEQGNDNNE